LPRSELLEGSIDDQRRPLVRIEAPGFPDPLVAFIDTGFNGAVLMDEAQAARLGFRLSRHSIAPAQLASGRMENFMFARGDFTWFGERRPLGMPRSAPGPCRWPRRGATFRLRQVAARR
jgi:hypothetical protein